MKKLFILFLIFLNISAKADTLDSCLERIATSNEWQNGITEIFGTSALTEENVTNNKPMIYSLIAKNVSAQCSANLITIAKSKDERKKIYFEHGGKKYGFDFDVTEMFGDIVVPSGILVYKRGLRPNSILKLSDIPKKQKFFSDNCSDWTIADNLDDDASVNVAGQSVFKEFGGKNNEFFLDFAEGDNRRAFPGLVLTDETGDSVEKIVAYLNLRIAVQRFQQFAEKLKNSQCSNQNLAVYLVSLNSSDRTQSDSDAALATWMGGGAAAAGAAGTLAGITGTSIWVPVAGWGAAIVTGVTAAAIALSPNDIADIQQVTILDGPYNL